MRNVTFAVTQFKASDSLDANISAAEKLINDAADKGANVILLQALFASLYWCKERKSRYIAPAENYSESTILQHFSELAKSRELVLPINYFEKSGSLFFNSLAVIDADGHVLENYRKSHIPDAPGNHEKFYFSPGDTGFKVWQTRFGRLGAAICSDQWFPETARILTLNGAEAILYPCAVERGSLQPGYDALGHWQKVIQGQSAANMLPIVASNRVGAENLETCEVTFYGSSFITDQFGTIVNQLDKYSRGIACQKFDLDTHAKIRLERNLSDGRRPDLYSPITQN